MCADIGDLKAAPQESRNRTAYMFAAKQSFGPYRVKTLSAGGVLVTGRRLPAKGSVVDVLVLEPGQNQIRLPAQVVYIEQTGTNVCSGAVVFQEPAYDLIDQPEIENEETCPETAEFCGPVILVVDDCEDVCRILKVELERLGRKVVYAINPMDAISMLIDPDLPIDSVVVDLFLGEYDGMDVLRFISKRRPELRRVLISGQVSSRHLELARASGSAHAVLPKPWDRASLADALAL